MKKKTRFSILIVFSMIIIFTNVRYPYLQQSNLERCPLNPNWLNPPHVPVEFGLLPHPVDLSHLQRIGERVYSVPGTWDWRDYGGVTSVKDQSSCGSCWAFAATGDLESSVLVNQGSIFDFSEENLKECNYLGRGCGGGNAWTATNYFTRQGTVLESCDPYHPEDTGNCKTTCEKIKQVTNWRILPDDTATIKSAVYQYGPCYTSLYASFSGFSSYDGSECLFYDGSESPNHAVLIVGWDDDMTHEGGTGAWICKNSWGTDWGDNGYFYIAYGSARIGENSSFYESYKHFDYLEMTGTLYHYDEAGWYDNWGFGSPNEEAWGLVKFISNKDDCIYGIDFWAVDDDMQYTIYIYDDFDGSTLTNLLYSQSGICDRAGYYSIILDKPIWISRDDDFIVALQFNCSNYYWPVPCDRYAPIETEKCYISDTGEDGSWTELGDTYGRDVSIRARTKNHTHVFFGHDFDGDGFSDVSLFRPSSAFWFLHGIERLGYGKEGDIPVNGDYNGNGITDVAVFRPFNGLWAVKDQFRVYYGLEGDIPVPGDYDGDGVTDIAVFRPSSAMWAVKDQFEVYYGLEGDIPVPGDYDGDGVTDIAVFRPSSAMWAVKDQFEVYYGLEGDIPVPGDYDGDGVTDIAVFRPSNGMWAIKDQFRVNYGLAGDIPVPGDYDGDGMTDVAVFRPSNGMWAIKDQFRVYYGGSEDIPVVR